MNSLLKSGILGVMFGTSPLMGSIYNFNNYIFVNDELSEVLANQKDEKINKLVVVGVEPKIVVDAVLNYFGEEVKIFKLSKMARIKITELLDGYLSKHEIFKVGTDGNLVLEIDSKVDFALMVKGFVNIIMEDMPFFIRKVVIPLFLGGNGAIQQKLDNLDETVFRMKKKEYETVLFDYIAGFVKRVAIYSNSNMKIGDYCNLMSGYYPNESIVELRSKLVKLGLWDQDIKKLKYPF